MNTKNIAILLAIVLIGLSLFIFITNPTLTMQKEHITNAFIDVNGDGMVDFLVNGDVILNNGTSNFPFQPTNSQP